MFDWALEVITMPIWAFLFISGWALVGMVLFWATLFSSRGLSK